MKFEKGKSGNVSGRPKGAENKETKKLRQFLGDLLEDNQDKFNEELLKLSGFQFIQAFSGLLEYCTPKLNRTDMKIQDTTKRLPATFKKQDGTEYTAEELIKASNGVPDK